MLIGLIVVEIVVALAVVWMLHRLRGEVLHNRTLISNHVAHELKTPLTTIYGTLLMLERSHDRVPPDKLRELVGSAIQKSEELDRLITDMVTLEPQRVTKEDEATPVRV
jgi:signal transduction histidine kinase